MNGHGIFLTLFTAGMLQLACSSPNQGRSALFASELNPPNLVLGASVVGDGSGPAFRKINGYSLVESPFVYPGESLWLGIAFPDATARAHEQLLGLIASKASEARDGTLPFDVPDSPEYRTHLRFLRGDAEVSTIDASFRDFTDAKLTVPEGVDAIALSLEVAQIDDARRTFHVPEGVMPRIPVFGAQPLQRTVLFDQFGGLPYEVEGGDRVVPPGSTLRIGLDARRLPHFDGLRADDARLIVGTYHNSDSPGREIPIYAEITHEALLNYSLDGGATWTRDVPMAANPAASPLLAALAGAIDRPDSLDNPNPQDFAGEFETTLAVPAQAKRILLYAHVKNRGIARFPSEGPVGEGHPVIDRRDRAEGEVFFVSDAYDNLDHVPGRNFVLGVGAP